MNNLYTKHSGYLASKRQKRAVFFRARFLLLFILLLGGTSISAEESVSGYQITSPVSGVIKKVYVQNGKKVNQGELLLEFDNTLINSNLAEAQAQLKLAKINLSEAKKELERANELYDRTVLSEHDLQLAKISYSKASAQYSSSENQLVHAQWDKGHSKLYSPFNGRVVKLLSYQGQYVNNKLSAQTLLIIK